MYKYWSTIDNSSSPHFHLNSTGFVLSSLHTSIAHLFTFAVTLHFLVYSSAFTIYFCNPSGVSAIPTKSSANINPDTVSSPILAPCFAVSTALIRSLVNALKRVGDNVHHLEFLQDPRCDWSHGKHYWHQGEGIGAIPPCWRGWETKNYSSMTFISLFIAIYCIAPHLLSETVGGLLMS